jgi:hypothetical protein
VTKSIVELLDNDRQPPSFSDVGMLHSGLKGKDLLDGNQLCYYAMRVWHHSGRGA